jgi:formylglycine-generating enzyme required for sulfatase activity
MKSILIAALLFSVSLLHANVPALINYQGLLTDINGNVVSGSKTVSISIHDAATNGTQLYSESIGSVTVQNGIYSFQFGSGPTFTTTLATGSQHWLQVTVNGEVQTPRERLVAVPFAIHSASVSDEAITQSKLDPLLKAALGLADPGFVRIGDLGNPNDSTGFGAVGYSYQIGKFEVTLSEYTEFLNAVAHVDTYQLYDAAMTTNLNIAGIQRMGIEGSYIYSIIGSSSRPVTMVTWFDAARYCNWLHNGKPSGLQDTSTTENGSYDLNGAMSGVAISRNLNARYWIPSEDEWYKAAYYQPATKGGDADGYWSYPTRSNSAPGNTIGAAANQANYNNGVYSVTQSPNYSNTQNYLTEGGSFSASSSYYGTYDQAGNVSEWNEAIMGITRGLRGGMYKLSTGLTPGARYNRDPAVPSNDLGIRIAKP